MLGLTQGLVALTGLRTLGFDGVAPLGLLLPLRFGADLGGDALPPLYLIDTEGRPLGASPPLRFGADLGGDALPPLYL